MLRRNLFKAGAAAAAIALATPALVQADEPIPVVATFSILGDMVKEVGGEHVAVTTLVGPGGDGHVYQPTPADARAVKGADVLFLNGLEFEGWIDRLVQASEFQGIKVAATDGIEAIAYEEDDHHGHGEHAFEWAGVFDLAAGTYKWSFAKVDGGYADPAMKMVILESGDIEASEEMAEKALGADVSEAKQDAGVLVAQETAYTLAFDDSKDMTVFTVDIKKDGKYAFFTEHMPFEFEADEHFFKDLAGVDVEPVAQEPDVDHGHGHGEHAFEWAGAFELAAGSYKWSFAKVDGGYADPAMKMVILDSNSIEASEAMAEKALGADAADAKKDGDVLVAQSTAYSLNFDDSKDMTIFTVDIPKDGTYTFFTEHMPFEFEANEHFFKDVAGVDVEPVAQEPDEGHGHHHHHHHGAFDPHAWQSPANAVIYVNNITAALVKADPGNAADYQKNRDAYVAEIEAIDADIMARMKALPEDARTVVTSHDAFGYFAQRYGLTFDSPVGVSTEAEASAADVARLIGQIRDGNVSAVFVETITDNRLMEQIVRETDAKIGGELYSDALSPADGPAATYLDMMRHNAKMLSQALGS